MPYFFKQFSFRSFLVISFCTLIFFFSVYQSVEIDKIKLKGIRNFFINNGNNTSYEAISYQTEKNFDDSYFEDTNFDQNPFYSGLNLWSQDANNVNWSEPLQMCEKILSTSIFDQNDQKFISLISEAQKWKIPRSHDDESIFNLLSNCSQFRQSIPFPIKPASKIEASFPLAYVLIGARNAAQTVRFFRNIYQPQNVYCLTYDTKSSAYYQKSIRRLVECFTNENVFLSPEPEPIHYMMYSVLHSAMVCLEVLYKNRFVKPWRYVQIVSWNDFPLRTNLEMIEIFKILNGSQDSALDPIVLSFIVPNFDNYGGKLWHKRPIPDGLNIYKGCFATSMSREFVEFMFTDEISRKFFHYLRETKVAEEHYWPTLIHNLHLNAPGQFPGQCLNFYQFSGVSKPFVSRFQTWDFKFWHNIGCKGKYTFHSCVFGLGDIPILIRRPELIAHKIHDDFEPSASLCLEYWYWMRRYNSTNYLFNRTYYENLPGVRYQNSMNKKDFIC